MNLDWAALAARVLLNHMEHEASAVFHDIYEAGFTAEEILAFGKEKWLQYFSPQKLSRILQVRNSVRVDAVLDLLKAQKIGILPIEDEDYPNLLKQIHNPPRILYYLGKLPPREGVLISVVGSRDATTSGRYHAEELGRFLALNGIGVVSGLARGIDTSAHEGVLKGSGRALAVVGCGIVEYCRPRLKPMHQAILQNGCIMSEFPPEFPVYRRNFPVRNRIITGMSVATVVVEAQLRSGTMVSARLALEQGREVFAFPGPAFSPSYMGNFSLIRSGANLVANLSDILQDLNLGGNLEGDSVPDSLLQDSDAMTLLQVLTLQPQTLEELSYRTQMPLARLIPLIVRLEDSSALQRLPGELIAKKAP